MKYSIGFFVYDALIGIYKGYNTIAMTTHHAVAIMFYGWCFYTNKYGSESIYAVLLTETTNLLFNCSEILEILEIYPNLNSAIKILFALTFIVLRGVFGYIYLITTQASGADPIYLISPTLIYIISMHWIWIMVNKLARMAKDVNIN